MKKTHVYLKAAVSLPISYVMFSKKVREVRAT